MENQASRMKPDQSVDFCILIRFLKVCATFIIIISKWKGCIPGAILGLLSALSWHSLSSFSAQKVAECAGHHRIQSGHSRTAAAGLFWARSDRAGGFQLRTRQRARTHRVQRKGRPQVSSIGIFMLGYLLMWHLLIFLILLIVVAQSAGCWSECTARNGSHWAEATFNGGERTKSSFG